MPVADPPTVVSRPTSLRWHDQFADPYEYPDGKRCFYHSTTTTTTMALFNPCRLPLPSPPLRSLLLLLNHPNRFYIARCWLFVVDDEAHGTGGELDLNDSKYRRKKNIKYYLYNKWVCDMTLWFRWSKLQLLPLFCRSVPVVASMLKVLRFAEFRTISSFLSLLWRHMPKYCGEVFDFYKNIFLYTFSYSN